MDNTPTRQPVIDLVGPVLGHRRAAVRHYIDGGVDVVGATVFPPEGGSFDAGRAGIARIRRLADGDDRLVLVTDVDDISKALREKRLGVLVHAQSLDFVERDLGKLHTLRELGLRVAQLAYNRRNFIADGCQEPADAGLSLFGREVVEEMNELGIVLDLSHCGAATSMEALRLTKKPAVFSHSGASHVYPHVRNISDDLIRAVMDTGGVVGFNAVPSFNGPEPALRHIVRHAVRIAEVAGSTEHLGMGLDFMPWMFPYMAREELIEADRGAVGTGLWFKGDFHDTPTAFAPGIETPAQLPNLVKALRQEFGSAALPGILGANWLRVFSSCW